MRIRFWRREAPGPALKLAQVAVVTLTPLVLVLSSIRLAATEMWVTYEYSMSEYSRDIRGQSKAERLELAHKTLSYVSGDSPMEALTGQNGERIFDEDELRHLADVRRLLEGVALFQLLGIVLLGVSLLVLGSDTKMKRWIPRLLALGGLLTLTLVTFLVVPMTTAWESFFLGFHQTLFPPGTWEFSREAMLIRLFPETFWVDSALAVVVLTVIPAVILSFLPEVERRFRKA